MQHEFVAETYTPENNLKMYPSINKDYGRIKARFTQFDWNGKIQCYIELKITRKVPKSGRGNGFEMKEFTFNGNSLHVGKVKDFTKIPNYEAMAKRWNTSVFTYIYKDFGIMPFEYYKNIWI